MRLTEVCVAGNHAVLAAGSFIHFFEGNFRMDFQSKPKPRWLTVACQIQHHATHLSR